MHKPSVSGHFGGFLRSISYSHEPRNSPHALTLKLLVDAGGPHDDICDICMLHRDTKYNSPSKR